jgi:hypothetical protein
MEIAINPKNRKIYRCLPCDYNTCNLYDFNKHKQTKKHSQSGLAIAMDNLAIACDKKIAKKCFSCPTCNKVYKDNSGLWKHKKKCELISTVSSEELPHITDQITQELVLSILGQNKDIIEHNKELTNIVLEQNKTIIELAKNNPGNVINSNNVNSNNKTFNLNVFLNEYCKDAMNITEFVDSLKLQVSDLENMAKVGFVQGITNIIVKNLRALDIYKRPVHCADKKREVIYIKDEDKWEKETDQKNTLRKAIKKVVDKNQRLLPKYREAHPGCNFAESKYSDIYNKIVIEALGGEGNNDTEKEDKIIRNIAKEVVIDKTKVYG